MVVDDRYVDDCGQIYTEEIRKSQTVRVLLRTIIMQDRHDDFIPNH